MKRFRYSIKSCPARNYVTFSHTNLNVTPTFCSTQLHVFLPLYLIGVGGVLMVDGVAIYDYLTEDPSKKFLMCRDILNPRDRPDIHGDSKHIPVEFAGALTAVVFYVSHSKYNQCQGASGICCIY